MISVIIATRNRPEKIAPCLRSVLANKYSSFEIIIIDQGDGEATGEKCRLIRSSKTRYFRLNNKGKSKALNFALNKAKGKIIAFTDDDCLVEKNWLEEITKSFLKHPQVAAVFGKSLPYRSEKNKDLFCACTFSRKREVLFNKPVDHWQVGYGNNMAFRANIFKKIGNFKEWLGPGSVGRSAEDAEIILRTLFRGCQILYNPKMTIYHDRWLSLKQFRKQQWLYSWAETACYGYYFFCGEKLAKDVLRRIFSDTFQKGKTGLKELLLLKISGLNKIGDCLIGYIYKTRGLVIGFLAYKKDCFQKMEYQEPKVLKN